MRAAWEYKRLMSTRMALAIFLLAAALGAALPVESRVVEESASLPAASLMDDGRNMASELGFGKAMLKHFSIDKEYINLNHGSYGSTPKHVQAATAAWRAQMERNPDVWMRKEQYAEMDRVRGRMAEYLGADSDDVVFVENASHGINSVLRSLLVGKGGKVLVLNLAYQMVKNALSYLQDTFGASVVQVEVPFPFASKDVIAAVQSALDSNPDVTLAVVDHVTSCPALVMPLDSIVPLLKARGIVTVIDGAHALGHLRGGLDIPSMGVDFYVTNGHKWLYSPKSSAILWARPGPNRDILRPTTISGLGKGNTTFKLQFSYQGTTDVTPYIAMGDALDFRASIGGEDAITAYLHRLARDGGAMLSNAWGTRVLEEEGAACAMANIELPPCTNGSMVAAIPWALMDGYGTWVPTYEMGGGWWTRVSAQIYGDLSDWKYLAAAVGDLYAAGGCPIASISDSSQPESQVSAELRRRT